MNMRVDMIVLDTWGASGLCFADNDTESVLKAMFVLKNIARRTAAATIVTDHLPLGNGEAWQKGNGAKSGNAGFVYRVSLGERDDEVSIDCGKTRGTPNPKSYTGRMISENYGLDQKGRTTTVNIFKRNEKVIVREQSVVMKLMAMLPGVVGGDMDRLRAGYMVQFERVAAEIGQAVHGSAPQYVVNKEAALKMFDKEGMQVLLNSGYLRTMRGCPFIAVYTPTALEKQALTMPLTTFGAPANGKMPWQ